MNFEEVNIENLKFQHPFTMIVTGPTKAGKTIWVSSLLQNIEQMITPVPVQIFWHYSEWQPGYNALLNILPNIQFIQDFDNFSQLKKDPDVPKLVILDDLMTELAKNKNLNNLFTKGSHHWNLSCIFIVQNLYFEGIRCARLNTHYLILFRSPDKQQINCFGRQLYPSKPKILLDAYIDVITNQKYSPLIVDMTTECPDNMRLRSNIFPNESTVIYSPKL